MAKNFRKGLIACLALMLMTAPVFTGCGGGKSGGDETSSEQVAITLSLDKTSHTVKEDDVFSLVATTNSTRALRWTSSDETIASVNSSGRVLAKKAGTVVITANAEGTTAECVVTILAGDPNAGSYLRASESALMLDMQSGATKTIAMEYVSVSNGEESIVDGKTFTYRSADEGIATVSEDGVVTPVSTGTTDIIITVDDLTEYVTADVYTAAVSTPVDWLNMLTDVCNVNSRYYLKNDIDFSETAYDIGDLADKGSIEDNFFGAEVNGNYHSVKNITFAGAYQSLFGVTVGLKLKNISFDNILFTADAVRAAGIAHTFGQHTSGLGVKDQVFESEISNVKLDFLFETAAGTGISWTNYGINIHDVFISMRKAEGATVTEYPEVKVGDVATKAFVGVSRVGYNWGFGKSNMRNVIVYCNVEGCGQTVNMGYGTFGNDNIVYTETIMQASYNAYTILDKTVWDVQPNALPKFI